MSKSTKILGLITAPGYTEELVDILESSLPDLLSYYVNEEDHWEVDCVTDSLTGVTEDSREVLGAALERKSDEGWDFAVALTDLPFFKNKRPIVAEAYEQENVAMISIPGLGSTPMFKRIRESVLQLVNEMYYGSSEKDREQAEQRLESKNGKQHKELKNRSSTRLVGKRPFEWVSPLQRETPDDDESNIDVRFTVKSRVSGALRVLTGMVRANRPWAMFPAFLKLIMIAFATGSYAIVFPTLWMLSSDYGIWRMFLLTFVSIGAMTVWIILVHSLWEKKNAGYKDYIRKLYNAATVLTLFVSVCMYYVILFLLFSLAVLLIIPMGMLESQVTGSVSYINYFYIAWTATSIATIIGALGSALENEDVVLSSTYGYRQRQRYKQVKEAEEEKKEAEEEKKEAAEEKKEAAEEKQEAEEDN
ncbi:MFS transporter [Thalassobacillus devorans]|uniref:MFS transporter n=1 Tax=Thalassobacillus devorans TaxID=279813 RepID=UPI000A1CACC8|nr:MFS transporter [Thalassobacillus devorans]